MDTQIYISVEKYCKIKDISRMTFYRKKIYNKIPYRIVKKENFNKRCLIIDSKDIITIKSDKNGIIM